MARDILIVISDYRIQVTGVTNIAAELPQINPG